MEDVVSVWWRIEKECGRVEVKYGRAAAAMELLRHNLTVRGCTDV